MKWLFKNKVFSGALQFTIFIGVIIALLLTGLVMLQNTHTYFIEQSKATIENIQLANSGINYLLNQKKVAQDTLTISELTNENQKVEVHLSTWGIFEKGIVKTTHRKKIFYKSALLGTKIPKEKRPSLYLQDNYKPLVVVGKTLLKGLFFIPSQGISPGYIAGESFYGEQLVEGTIKNSTRKLPELLAFYKELEELFNKNTEFSEENYLRWDNTSKIINSFLKPTKIMYQKDMIELDGTSITGNIIIKSDELVKIKKTAVLKDVIIIAPIVEIEDDVLGTFQVMANKRITVGKSCKLNYPSALVLIQEKESLVNFNSNALDYQIRIEKNSQIIGTVCYFKSIKENDFKTQVTLSEESIVKGEIYCQGNLELKGKVVGSVFTEQFILSAAGSIFINHLYNGQIVNDNFPESFSGLLFKDNLKSVAKWMY
ncbi:hypothetical protein [Flavobacterium sp.]|uniref:hypothetical protein n=1 Tax=Flavobacterium sp. TaxID=239 RepID=UPI0026138D63|nr:hypothetical protein [Flavobacterium sp.]